MIETEITKDPWIHCTSGGSFEQYNIKYSTSITLVKDEIEAIKNGNITKDNKKIYKKYAKFIGQKVITELLNHITKEGSHQ